MPIAVLVLTLVAWAYILLAYPEIRLWTLAAGAVVAAGLAFHFWQQPSEATRAANRIAPAELALDRLDLEETARGATLTGRVHNRSDAFTLREMTLLLRLHDCPRPDAEPASCPIVGEGEAIARPDAPPGQIRGFSAHFLLTDLPPVAGTLRWDWRILATRATDG